MSRGRRPQPHREDSAHGQRRPLQKDVDGATGHCDQRRCPAPPHLEHGCQDYHRQRHDDEQGLRGDRGQMALRCGGRPDSGARASPEHCPQCRSVCRRCREGTVGCARHAPAHPVCLLLPRTAQPVIGTARPFQPATRVFRARPEEVPLPGSRLRVDTPGRQHALHRQCGQRNREPRIPGEPMRIPRHERHHRENHATRGLRPPSRL